MDERNFEVIVIECNSLNGYCSVNSTWRVVEFFTVQNSSHTFHHIMRAVYLKLT